MSYKIRHPLVEHYTVMLSDQLDDAGLSAYEQMVVAQGMIAVALATLPPEDAGRGAHGAQRRARRHRWRQLAGAAVSEPAPLTAAELEADLWASWWLAHQAIGEQVRAGLRELPECFRPSRREPAE